MKPIRSIIFLSLALLAGCNKGENNTVQPDEVAAIITSEVVIDNFSKGCSGGGLVVDVNSKTYTIANPVPASYAEANARPLPVWIRYEVAPPDECTQSTNRITVLSIRKRG